jgi:glycosyltransferase involved in cell wall biosynthesis
MNKVDVIIPFHRGVDRYLLAAITSTEASVGILPNIILVNDRPEDTSATTFLRRAGYQTYVSNGGGYVECLNLGIQYSESRFVAQLNSDDLQHPTRIGKQIQLIEEGADLSLTKLSKFGGFGRNFQLSGKQPSNLYEKSQLLLGAYGANSSLVARRDFFEGKEYLSTLMSDWKFAFDHYPANVPLLNQPFYYYRMHKAQVSRTQTVLPEWLDDTWRRHFNMPAMNISTSLIIALSLPAMKQELQPQDFKVMHQVFFHLLNQLGQCPGQYISQYRRILMRRLIIAALRNRQLFSIMNFSDIFSMNSLLREMGTFGIELGVGGKFARK